MRAAFLALILSAIGLVAVLDGFPWALGAVFGQDSLGCQFQIYNRRPVEFAGAAGGYDFRLYNPTRHGADIKVFNIYGDAECPWNARVNKDWVTLSKTNGRLGINDDTSVTVSINDRARSLARGTHSAEIVFTSSDDPQPSNPKKVKVVLYAEMPCDLQVIGGSYSGRAQQGEVPPQTGVAKLNNRGDTPCEWQAHSNAPWLTVVPSRGKVRATETQQLVIKANGSAANLVPDDYRTVVELRWRETHDEYLEIGATLEIDAPPCELHFAEGQKFQVKGKAGSADFAPNQQRFVLENLGGTPCYYWQAHGIPDWLEINDEETIYGKSQTDVVVRVNLQAASLLQPDEYGQTVRFGSGNVSATHGLDVFMDVEPLPCHLEIDSDPLHFRIEPEGQLPEETELPVTLTNSWTNVACDWQVDSGRGWLAVEPSAGTLAGGDSAKIGVRIVRNTAEFVELDPGKVTEELWFVVEEGTPAEPLPVTLDIACKVREPCAYLHTTHTKTEVGKPATISLTIYNPLDIPISAQLIGEVPSGWEISSESFAERCSAICNHTYVIAGLQQEFIELLATPNNPGDVEFHASVSWLEYVETGGPRDSAENPPEQWDQQNLEVDVEVIDPSAGEPSAQTETADNSATPSAAQAQPAATTVTPPTSTPDPVSTPEAALLAQGTGGGSVLPVEELLPPQYDGGSRSASAGSGELPPWVWPAIAVGGIVMIVAVVWFAIGRGFRTLASQNRNTPNRQRAGSAQTDSPP